MTEVERAIAAQKLGERLTDFILDELAHVGDANEQGAIAMIACTGTAVVFAAIRNMDARATLAEINVLAQSIAEDVHGGRP